MEINRVGCVLVCKYGVAGVAVDAHRGRHWYVFPFCCTPRPLALSNETFILNVHMFIHVLRAAPVITQRNPVKVFLLILI